MSRPSVFGHRASGLRLERIRASSRFIDGAFRNPAPVSSGIKKGQGGVFKDFLFSRERRVPTAALPLERPLDAWARPSDTGFRTTWLGHSTVLLELGGARVLTDPVFGDRASPLKVAGPKRFHPVPATIAELPPLDAVIVSHDHYDHLDYPSILELARRDVPFYTSLGVGAHLEAWGIPPERIVELDWWETAKLARAEVTITAAPSQHFSGRAFPGRNSTLWSSFVVKSDRHSVFFSGDTGLTQEYAEIRERLGPFSLAMLEVGAFHPAWGDIHLGPENALEANRLLGNPLLLPVHWGTFNLGIHPWDEPPLTLVELAPKKHARLLMPRLGEAIEPPRGEHVDPWWRAVAEAEQRAQQRRPEPSAPAEQPTAPPAPID